MLIYGFILAFLVVGLIQYILYRVYAMRKLRYSCALSQSRVAEGDTVELFETIENGSYLPMLWVKTETHFNEALVFLKNDSTRVSASTFHRSILSVPPSRRIRRTYRIACTRRGYYRFGSSALTAGDLLGVSSFNRDFSNNAELHVYPLPLHSRKLRLPSRLWQGDMVVRRFILPDPFMPAGVRDYVPGDPVSYINWKASAKTGNLAVHKHDYTSDSKLLIIFNIDQLDREGAAGAESLETAVSLLASIVELAISNGQQVGLWSNALSLRDGKELTLPPSFGRRQREKLFIAMAEMYNKCSRSFYMLLREAVAGMKNMDVLLMTHSMSKEAQIEASELRKAGNNVEVLLIPR